MSIVFLGVNSIFLLLLAWAFYTVPADLRFLYWPALTLKVLAGIALGLIYTFYYTTADTFYFFNDGRVLANLFKEDGALYLKFLWHGDDSFTCWKELTYHDNRSLFLIKFISVVNILTRNNYWLTATYFSLISFAASWRFLQTLIRYFPAQKLTFVIACLGIPTVVFWSSGVIKESMEVASLYLITSVFLKFWMRNKATILDIVLFVFSTWVLWQVKYYYAAILLPVLVTTGTVHRICSLFFKSERPMTEIGIWLGVFIIPMVAISFFHPNFHVDNFLGVVIKNYYLYKQYSRPDAIIHYTDLQATVGSILVNSPWALFSCLFRPFLWEVSNPFQGLVALENAVLFILTLFAIPQLKRAFLSEHRLLYLSIVIYVVLLGVFLALSAPNFGTLSRFRAGFIPFYVMMVSIGNPIIKRLSNIMERKFSRLVR